MASHLVIGPGQTSFIFSASWHNSLCEVLSCYQHRAWRSWPTSTEPDQGTLTVWSLSSRLAHLGLGSTVCLLLTTQGKGWEQGGNEAALPLLSPCAILQDV